MTLKFSKEDHPRGCWRRFCLVDIAALHDRETWLVDTDDEQGATTLLVRTRTTAASDTVDIDRAVSTLKCIE